jgi:CRISPR type I-E-associated protein CasB/Cse2
MTPTWQDWQAHAERFVQRVIEVCCGRYDKAVGRYEKTPDPGARAALRLGLRKPVEQFSQSAHKAVFAAALGGEDPARAAIRSMWLSGSPHDAGLFAARERAYYAVAAMIAAQARDARDSAAQQDPAAVPVGGLGVSVASMDRGEPIKDETPREKELRALSKQSFEGIHRSVPDLVGHLRARDIDVDWARLLVDLSQWPYRRDEVTKRWNQDYYRTRYRHDAEDRRRSGTEQDPGNIAPDDEEDEAGS